jgi:hypothetical protein
VAGYWRGLDRSGSLQELANVRIVAVAGGPGGLWVATPAGLFHFDPGALN